jgi:S-adenosylmethionine:tRNA ribosyltransferase-isomerase
MERHGEMPLPPYVRREPGDPRAPLDAERYQTVYARTGGAVAAPTAGLHLTDRLLGEFRGRGVRVASLTLHVGLGTFQPVRTERVDDHPIHAERYEVPEGTAAALREARARGGRVVAVGTTTVRALEAAALVSDDGLPRAGPGLARLLIVPGHRFRAVDAMLTNFHLPRSTLLALVAAFGGLDRVLTAYHEAVAREYRFYSYGDAMFVG